MKSKQAKAHEFSPATRQIIKERDGGCIFCQIGYHMEEATTFDREVKDIMHYIPRSAGGLGIPENAAVGCRHHHSMYDNGNSGRHEEMKELFKGYLMERYPGWNEKELVYNKWGFLEGGKL